MNFPIVIFFLFSFLVSPKLFYFKAFKPLHLFISFLFLFCLCAFVTYTPDWDAYEYMIQSDSETDYLFKLIVALYKYLNIDTYKSIHITFIFSISLLLITFLKEFDVNYFVVIVLFLVLNYLVFTTQIRYFLGFFGVLISLKRFNDKRYLSSFWYFLFSLFSHMSLILFLPFYFLINSGFKQIKKFVIFSIISLFISSTFLVYLLPDILYYRFILYFESEHRASILGSLYFFLPSIINISFLLIYLKIVYSLNSLNDLPDISKFLLKITFISFYIFGLALNIQVFGSRIVEPIFFVQSIFYLSEIFNRKGNLAYIFLFLSFLLNFIIVYILPFIIFGLPSYFTIKVLQVLLSNTLIFS